MTRFNTIYVPPGGSGGGGAPSGAAGGALSGTYPNPGIADNTLLAGTQADLMGYLSMNMDPALSSSNLVLATAGTTYLAKTPWPYTGKNIASVDFGLQTAGSVLTAGQCWVLVYHSNGTLLGQAAAEGAAFVGAAAIRTISLSVSSANLPAVGQGGFIWIGFVFNGTTGPAISRAPNAQPQAIVNGSLTASTMRFGTGPTGVTTTPGNLTPASNSPAAGQSLFVGVK